MRPSPHRDEIHGAPELGLDQRARDDLAIGMPVEVHFDPVGDGVALPVFRTRTEGDR